MKRRFFKNSLYVLLDDSLVKKSFSKMCRQIIAGGADVIQLRVKFLSDKEFLKIARDLRTITRRCKSPFIINDRVDIAIACDADGVHLGQDDLPLPVARNFPGIAHKIIGISTHSLKEARQAQKDGADYISVGPIFASATKPRLKAKGTRIIRRIKQSVKTPVVAIGGIDKNNIRETILTGADGIAVVSAVLKARSPEKATRELKNQMKTSLLEPAGRSKKIV